MANKDQVQRLRTSLSKFQQDVDNVVTACRNRMDDENCTDQELAGIEENLRTWTNQIDQQRQRITNKGTTGYGR